MLIADFEPFLELLDAELFFELHDRVWVAVGGSALLGVAAEM